jgi:hypothetical protein
VVHPADPADWGRSQAVALYAARPSLDSTRLTPISADAIACVDDRAALMAAEAGRRHLSLPDCVGRSAQPVCYEANTLKTAPCGSCSAADGPRPGIRGRRRISPRAAPVSSGRLMARSRHRDEGPRTTTVSLEHRQPVSGYFVDQESCPEKCPGLSGTRTSQRVRLLPEPEQRAGTIRGG